jgi:hypothetical protein
MAAADDSLKQDPAQGVQTSPAAGVQAAPEAPPIPLPPLPQPAPDSPERFLRWVKGFDAVIVAAVVAFAFLVASFPAYNSDFFLSVATGRLLAHGQYQFGVDPFSFTAGGEYWVNHSWLFSLLLYALYSLPGIGGAAVVVAKALLVAGVAVLMIATGRRPGQSLWVPAALAGLAVLALSPRVFLQSVCVSYLFLALTLYLLRRPRRLREEAPRGAPPARHPYLAYWLIPVLCALWVNLDNWFLLGPLTVGLYLLGELLQDSLAPAGAGPDSFAPGERRTLALVLAASVAACLLNPHHVRAFTLPYQLGLTGVPDELARDPQFRGMFINPFEKSYYNNIYFGLSVAGLAYYPLLALGVASFVCALGGGWRWWRALLWLAFAALSAYNSRAISFFAIVAAPVTALNFLDFAARVAGGQAPEGVARRLALPGRFATVVLLLALSAATVPGWLQNQQQGNGDPYERWRLGWRVEADPGLVQVTEAVKQLQQERKLPTGTVWFNTAQEAASYFAWFCPGERTFLDPRLPLFEEAAGDYVAVRRALALEAVPDDDPGAARRDPAAWRKVFRDRGIKYLVHYDTAPGVRKPGIWVSLLMLNQAEWAPLALNGRAGVFGWRPPEEKQDPYQGVRLDFDRLAFGPHPPESAKAPPQRPARPPEVHEWWAALWDPVPPHPLAADDAWLFQSYFKLMGERWNEQNNAENQRHSMSAVSVQMAAAAGLGAGPGGPPVNGALFFTRVCAAFDGQKVGPQSGPFDAVARMVVLGKMPLQDLGPPASLYLAVRAARRALAANPDDAWAHLRLAEAYFSLHFSTREWPLTGEPNPQMEQGAVHPYLHYLRVVQIAAALHDAVRLNPDLQQAYFLQVGLYGQLKYREPQLKACEEYLRCLKTLPQAEPPDAIAKRIEAVDKDIKNLKDQIRKELDTFEIQTTGRNIRDKADYLVSRGLIDTALKLLTENPGGEELYETANNVRTARGVRLLYHLLLTTGQVEETRGSMAGFTQSGFRTEDNPLLFGGFEALPYFDWFEVLVAGASGDYQAGDEQLAKNLERMTRGAVLNAALLRWDVVPNTPRQLEANRTLPEWTALMVGHALLAEAPTAAGMPYQMLRQSWCQLQQPHQMRLLPASWPYLMQEYAGSVRTLVQPRADVGLVRAALALESGDTGAARKQLREVVEITGGRKGEGFLATLPARPVALMWLGWLEAYPE